MKADIIKAMKNQGLVVTEQRMCIIEAVCRIRFIADVEVFWLDLRASRPVSWATIYNTLRVLTECGILQRERRGRRFISYRLIAEQNKALKANSFRKAVENDTRRDIHVHY